MQTTETMIDRLISGLASIKDQHARTTDTYNVYSSGLRKEIELLFKNETIEKKPFGPLGEIVFPFFKMGNKTSLDLFDLDEFIIFSFYWSNRKKYKKALDIGANIGLHSLVLAKCGYEIDSFEPDPVHFKQLQHVMKINHVQNVTAHCGAVSYKEGQAEFVRVLGNTTSSHLAGCKNPYGELEKFVVQLFDIRKLIQGKDFMKMDVEGHEDQILLATKSSDWDSLDAMVEIGAPDKAKAVYEHLSKEGVNLFAQKINWEKVSRLQDVPVNYKEGSLFISKKSVMPWG